MVQMFNALAIKCLLSSSSSICDCSRLQSAELKTGVVHLTRRQTHFEDEEENEDEEDWLARDTPIPARSNS